MDSTLIANIDNATAASQFLTSQRNLVEDAYRNDNSYLSQAQQYSNSYMEMKQRIPMVIEYYQTPEEVCTVEMYINPNKLSFTHTKLISKTITRGGIFFHHYGEDTPTLQISGNTGLSGMRGIEQLEKIFNYSGTLLRYQDVGINKINNGDSEPREILTLDNAITAFDNLVSKSESLINIDETYEELLEQSTIALDKNESLLSKTKAAQLVSLDMALLSNTLKLNECTAASKVIVTQVNDILTEDPTKVYTFSDIFSTTKKCIESSNLDKDLDKDQLAFEIAWDIYEAKQEGTNASETQKDESLSDSSNVFGESNNNVEENDGLYNVYRCVLPCYLYSEPNYQSNRLKALSVNGLFTSIASSTGEYWTEHINGGYAPIKDPGNVYRVMDPPIPVYLYKDPYSGQVESNKASKVCLAPNGIFTSSESVTIDNVTWLKHVSENGWAPTLVLDPNDNLYYQAMKHFGGESAYLELLYANVRRYTVIRDDVYMYNEPNVASGRFSETPLYNGGLFTAVKREGNWVQHLGGNGEVEGWVPISLDGIQYLKEGFIDTNENSLTSGTDFINNNDITTNFTTISHEYSSALEKYLSEVRLWNKNSVIKWGEIESGFADILDELTDEWLPRLVFIYFEDRVFLGHFDKFTYDRIAETENIQYNMSFVIHRIVSVTSISPTRFEQQNTLENSGESLQDYEVREQYYIDECANGNDLPLKLAILRTRCIYYREQQEANWSGVPMTEERKEQIHNWAVKLRSECIYNGQQVITESTPIYGNTYFDWETYLSFMQLQYMLESDDLTFKSPAGLENDVVIRDAQNKLNLLTTIGGSTITKTDLQNENNLVLYDDVITPELLRLRTVWDTESQRGYTESRRRQIYNYANNLIFAIGARYANNEDFKRIYNNWLYMRTLDGEEELEGTGYNYNS